VWEARVWEGLLCEGLLAPASHSMSSSLDQAIKRVEEFLEPWQYQRGHPLLQAVSRIPNGERVLRRISNSGDVEEFRDYLAEINYALAFVGLGYEVEVEPEGPKGPDLRVCLDKHALFAEVTRLRLSHEMPVADLSATNPMLSYLGDPLQDVRRAFQKTCDKLPQLSSGPGMLAVWNDDEVLDELHMRTAAHWLQEELQHGRLAAAQNLQLVVLHTKWVSVSRRQEFYTWTPHESEEHWIAEWRATIEHAKLREALEVALRHLLPK
jgi:hypothetical protein